MKSPDPDRVLMEQAMFAGYVEAVQRLLSRRLDYDTAADLMNLEAADCPAFLLSPRQNAEFHETVRKLQDQLRQLAADRKAARG